MTGSQKRALAGLIAVLIVLIIIVGGYMFILKRFPMDHADIIGRYAAEYGLEPSLVAGVVSTESSFDADAESHAGAVGLMQLMPDTAEWIAGKMDMDDYSEELLNDEETNISMGCWYLAYLLKRFDGNKVNALAAYNAGPGKVDEWLKDESYARDGELCNIPYKETADYVVRVERAQKIYEFLYDL